MLELEKDIQHFINVPFSVDEAFHEQQIYHDKNNIQAALENLFIILSTNVERDRPVPKLLRTLQEIRTSTLSIQHRIKSMQKQYLQAIIRQMY